ncbi:RxLR effector protein [Phytophthora megakarya]|uniref:RxLR effector protein n=1 Tax=Phytophthora megakarya TaxID=4795 RepID=A0A225W4E6_9STRA|nr:RxLR effector protein [Phytophthora megakarya]
MRISYIFAVIIAVVFQTSAFAVPVNRVSKTMIENVVQPVIADATQADTGRHLRQVHKNAEENELEEERSISKFGTWLKKQVPLTKGWKDARKIKKAAEEKARLARHRENIQYAGGVPKI